MVFEQDGLQIQLLDMLYFDDNDVVMKTKARPFCALSLRTEADTEIETEGKTLTFGDHDIAFFPANVGYVRRSHHDERFVFQFTLPNFVSYDIEILRDFHYEEMEPMFRAAYREWSTRAPGYYYRTAAYLQQIIAFIQEMKALPTVSVSPVIGEILEYIRETYADPALTVRSLAEKAHLSETSLRELFHRELGVSPKKYLLDLRMEHAQSLLNAGYDSVASVAEKTGFRDPKNFATAFRKKFGYPPSAQHYELTEASRIARDTSMQ